MFGRGANTWLSFRVVDLVRYQQLSKEPRMSEYAIRKGLKKLLEATVLLASDPQRSPLAKPVAARLLEVTPHKFYRVTDDFVRVCRRMSLA
jgi:hypothetical protein